MAFLDAWKRIVSSVKELDTIRNWTADRGYNGNDFQVVAIDDEGIVVHSEGAKKDPRVRRIDFEFIYQYWEDYNKGRITRASLQEECFTTRYVFSILKKIECENGGRLP